MSVYKHKKTPFYHYDFQYKGHRFHETTGTASLAAAKRIEAAERQKAAAEIAIQAREIAAGKRLVGPMTLAQVVERYWSEIAAPQVRSDQVLWSLNWLTAYFGDDKLISEIDGAEISRMVAARRGEKVNNVAVARGMKKDAKEHERRERKPVKIVSPARVNRSVTEPLRKVLYFARDVLGQHIRPIKWKAHMLAEPAERIRVMKAEQEALILPCLSEKYHPLVFAKKRIGPRIFELLKMKWSDIDWSSPRVEIEGKGGSRSSVPLPTDVRDILWSLPRRGDYVFTHQDGSRMTYSCVASAWKRACAKAGVSELGLHALRHTAATALLKRTNLRNVQLMLRHRDIRSTLRYAHADDADLRAALEAGAKGPEPRPELGSKPLKNQA
ncbi:MAG TPA: tyrosine-type recombinase/integrase [Roseiarcus sp.]